MENSNQEMTVMDERKRAVATQLLRKVYIWMAVGLGLTGIIAWMVAQSESMIALIYGEKVMLYVLIGLELLVIVGLCLLIKKINFATAFIGYMVFCTINGFLLSGVFLTYELSSIGFVFFITAGMFTTLAVIGTVTKKDLSPLRSFLYMMLTGLVLASIVMLITGNTQSMLFSAIGVFVFSGLTVVDAQKIRMRLMNEETMTEGNMKEALFGALEMYLDFINLFLKLLEIFGKAKQKK